MKKIFFSTCKIKKIMYSLFDKEMDWKFLNSVFQTKGVRDGCEEKEEGCEEKSCEEKSCKEKSCEEKSREEKEINNYF